MRPLRRHLFALCSSVSLVLLVAVGVVWVRSYWWTDQLVWTRVDGNRFLQSARGHLWLQMYLGDLSDLPRDDFGLQYRRFQPYTPPHSLVSFYGPDPRFVGGKQFRWGGFEWYTVEDRDGIVVATGVARCSSIALATAVLPIVWATLRTRSYVRQRRLTRAGLCTTCGYDLRASPAQCPECGAVAPADRRTEHALKPERLDM